MPVLTESDSEDESFNDPPVRKVSLPRRRVLRARRIEDSEEL